MGKLIEELKKLKDELANKANEMSSTELINNITRQTEIKEKLNNKMRGLKDLQNKGGVK